MRKIQKIQKITKAKTLIMASLMAILMPCWAAAQEGNVENRIHMELETGLVIIELNDKSAPLHAQRIRQLAREGFYDGVIFHRVIDGFMAQTGDPTGTGRGGSSYKDLKAEFSSIPFRRGTVGMARANDPDSANSQFFICFQDALFLNGQYTVIGQVIAGMDRVDAIARGEPPANPDKILRLYVASAADSQSPESPPADAPPPAAPTEETP